MNPLEVYKLLPKTNCGECIPKTCMSFAVFLQGSPDALEQCRSIETDKRAAIRSMLTVGDWRDELIIKLSQEITPVPFQTIAEDLGCHMENGKLVIRCIGFDYTLTQQGEIDPEPKNRWIAILLLHYVRNRGRGSLAGTWIAFTDLRSGLFKASSFVRECEDPLRQLIEEDPAGALSILKRLGAQEVSGFSSDLAVMIDLLPKVRALILYQHHTDEFPSSLRILFDGIAGEFLDVESLTFLCEGLVHTVRVLKRT